MAWMPPGRALLRERVRFEAQAASSGDGYGNPVEGGWSEVVGDRRVRLLNQRGGEAVQAARLTGLSVWVLDVPADSDIRKVTTEMRVVDCRDPSRVWAIRWIGDLDGRDRWRSMALELGVAT